MLAGLQKVLHHKGAWFAAVGLAIALPSAAQHYTFSEIVTGMDNLTVNSIVQGRAGYLWVGTENGLYRYDGRVFRRFGSAEGLRGRTIQNLFIASDGTLFVGTDDDGIYFERPDGGFTEIHPPAQENPFTQRIGTEFTALAPNEVVAVDRTGAFLLRRMASDSWTAEAMNLKGGTVWSTLATPDGALWYGCGTDLCRLAHGKLEQFGDALHLPQDHWQRMLLARDGHLWIRSTTHIGELVPTAAKGSGGSQFEYHSHDFPGPPQGVHYIALIEDVHGQVVASNGKGFGIFQNGRWRMVTERNGLTRYDISELYRDRQGAIWLGVTGHGLMRWAGQDQWEAYTTAEGLSDDIVWTSMRDRSGRMWVGTESGLNWIPAKGDMARKWKGPGVQTARADSLVESADGAIWMGSAAGGLARIDEHSLAAREWKLPEVFRILADHHNRLWVATDGGLYVVNTAAPGDGPEPVKDPAFAHPGMRFTDLALNGADGIWAASDEGLFRLDAKGWQHIDPGLTGAVPQTIAPDPNGNLWIAGAFPGIMRLGIESNRVVESQEISQPHLLSPEVVALMVDHRGWLWVGQDAGVTVYDGKTWRSFTRNDGLIWNDSDTNALSEDRDGTLWIGTSGGLSHMLRPYIVPTATPQAPAIAQIDFGHTAVTAGANIPWSAQPLSISIAALNFGDVQHTRIHYRLQPLEADWVETTEEDVRYARLEPGNYRFQVQTVSTSDGTSSPVTELSFRIAPRWWQSLGLRVALILLAVGVTALLWQRRLLLLHRRTRQLELAVQRRTEDLEREKAELLRTREQMRYYAEHDELTGLWNHRIIVERLRSEVDRSCRDSAPLSIILADLDYFKVINDTFGHPAGDLVLRRIGAVFQHSVRTYDWVGRYGGEEFLIILPRTGFDHARARADELRTAVEAMRILDGETPIEVTVSLGVASGLPTDYESLIRAADAALYRAKGNGRNCVMATEIEPTKAI